SGRAGQSKSARAAIRAGQDLTGIDGLPVSIDLDGFTKAAEAITGVAVIPVSVCPIRIELGSYELVDAGDVVELGRDEEEVFVPLAHTEGSLTLSMTRGARAAGTGQRRRPNHPKTPRPSPPLRPSARHARPPAL